jgi:hypothetical protein
MLSREREGKNLTSARSAFMVEFEYLMTENKLIFNKKIERMSSKIYLQDWLLWPIV